MLDAVVVRRGRCCRAWSAASAMALAAWQSGRLVERAMGFRGAEIAKIAVRQNVDGDGARRDRPRKGEGMSLRIEAAHGGSAADQLLVVGL